MDLWERVQVEMRQIIGNKFDVVVETVKPHNGEEFIRAVVRPTAVYVNHSLPEEVATLASNMALAALDVLGRNVDSSKQKL